jgi:hypothetical protein
VQRGMPEEMAIIESTPMPAVNSTHVTPPSTSGSSSITIKSWSPVKGRVLDWTNL